MNGRSFEPLPGGRRFAVTVAMKIKLGGLWPVRDEIDQTDN